MTACVRGARLPLASVVLVASVAWTGCAGGSETGNPVESTPIALSLHSSAPDVVAVSRGARGSAIAAAWVAFGQARFLGEAECARFGDLDVVGDTLLVADLARPGAVLRLPSARGEHCGLLLPLEMDSSELPDDAPDELHAHSVLLVGERADGTPFTLAYPEHDELELAVEDGALDPSAQSLLLSFDVATWLQDVDLEAAALEADGSIRIDADHNRALLDRFEVNLACSLELFADEDGDGRRTDGEPRLARCAPDGS
jgi:hypothetical protein